MTAPAANAMSLEVEDDIHEPSSPIRCVPANHVVYPRARKGHGQTGREKSVSVDDAAVLEEQIIGEVFVSDTRDHIPVYIDTGCLAELDRTVQLIGPDMRIAQCPCVLTLWLDPERHRERIHVGIDEGRGGFRPRGPGAGAPLVVERIEPLKLCRVRIIT